MPNVAIYVGAINNPDPYDQMQLSCTLVADGHSDVITFSAYAAFNATADEVNEAIRAAAVTAASGHSITVSGTDIKRVIGGALVTLPT